MTLHQKVIETDRISLNRAWIQNHADRCAGLKIVIVLTGTKSDLIPISAENCIEELETLLVDSTRTNNHANIRKVIGMYRRAELPDRTRPLMITLKC